MDRAHALPVGKAFVRVMGGVSVPLNVQVADPVKALHYVKEWFYPFDAFYP